MKKPGGITSTTTASRNLFRHCLPPPIPSGLRRSAPACSGRRLRLHRSPRSPGNARRGNRAAVGVTAGHRSPIIIQLVKSSYHFNISLPIRRSDQHDSRSRTLTARPMRRCNLRRYCKFSSFYGSIHRGGSSERSNPWRPRIPLA